MVDIGEPFVSGTPQPRPDDRAGLYNIAPHAKAKPGLPPDRARAGGAVHLREHAHVTLQVALRPLTLASTAILSVERHPRGLTDSK